MPTPIKPEDEIPGNNKQNRSSENKLVVFDQAVAEAAKAKTKAKAKAKSYSPDETFDTFFRRIGLDESIEINLLILNKALTRQYNFFVKTAKMGLENEDIIKMKAQFLQEYSLLRKIIDGGDPLTEADKDSIMDWFLYSKSVTQGFILQLLINSYPLFVSEMMSKLQALLPQGKKEAAATSASNATRGQQDYSFDTVLKLLELDISKEISFADIRKAYLNAIKIHHPDKNPNNTVEANANMDILNKGYHFLKKLTNPEEVGSLFDDNEKKVFLDMESKSDLSTQYWLISLLVKFVKNYEKANSSNELKEQLSNKEKQSELLNKFKEAYKEQVVIDSKGFFGRFRRSRIDYDKVNLASVIAHAEKGGGCNVPH